MHTRLSNEDKLVVIQIKRDHPSLSTNNIKYNIFVFKGWEIVRTTIGDIWKNCSHIELLDQTQLN